MPIIRSVSGVTRRGPSASNCTPRQLAADAELVQLPVRSALGDGVDDGGQAGCPRADPDHRLGHPGAGASARAISGCVRSARAVAASGTIIGA